MLFYLSLIAALPFLITAFPQNSDDASITQVDGFVFDGPAAPGFLDRIISTSTPTSTTARIRSMSDDEYNTCLRNCPMTHEYNPVCGSDNVDYTNPGGLGCAKRCGKNIEIRNYGRCSSGSAG